MANNDPFSPANDCSENPVAIGQPDKFGNRNAVDIIEFLGNGDNPVDGAASAGNPAGVSMGANGEDASELRCLG